MKTRKILSVLLAVVMVLSILPVAAVNSFADSTVYTSADGLWKYVLNDDGASITSREFDVPAYLGNEENVTIPTEIDGNTVVDIGDFAFTYNSYIKNVTVPNANISLSGQFAFRGCTALESINIPSSFRTIPAYAFYGCSSLKEISFPYGVATIGDQAFQNCTSLESVGFSSSMAKVGDYAFADCTSLKEVVLQRGITKISEGMFRRCSSLEEIKIPQSVLSIERAAFEYCTSLKQIDFVGTSSVEQIGNRAFYGCVELENIEIPNGVTAINEECFAECSNLKTVKLPDTVNTIYGEAFISCYNLQWILIPENVTQIAASAFDRSGLEYVLGYRGTYAEEYPDICTSQYVNELTFVSIDDYDCENGTHCNYVVYDDDGVTCECMICGEGFFDELPTLTDSEQVDFAVPAVDTGTSYDCYFNVAQTGFYTFEFEGAECSAVDICIGSESQEGYWYGYATTEHFEVPLMFEKNVNYLLFFRTDGLPESDSFSVKVNFNGEHRVESFPDMTKDDWYYEAAMYNSDRGFITGYKNGNFGGADKLQRQDFIVILGRIVGFDDEVFSHESLYCGLADVPQGAYYTSSVNWSVYSNIITGYNNGKFGVGDAITREQVATILYRYMGSPEVTGAEETLAPFADAGRISDFAKDAMVWAIQNGVISGKNATTLAPTATASRAEIATIIMRMDKANLFD